MTTLCSAQNKNTGLSCVNLYTCLTDTDRGNTYLAARKISHFSWLQRFSTETNVGTLSFSRDDQFFCAQTKMSSCTDISRVGKQRRSKLFVDHHNYLITGGSDYYHRLVPDVF